MTPAPLPPEAKVIFAAPIASSKHEDRVVVEHGDGRWSVARMLRADPSKLHTIEVTFTLADLREGIIAALQGDPAIQTIMNKQAGKGIAAGALLLLMAVGISDEAIDASAGLVSPPATTTGRAA